MRGVVGVVVAALALLSGCKGEPGPQGAQGPMGLQGLQGPKGDPGAPAQAVKLPHLIVAATGEDLGLRTQSTCVWADNLQGELCYYSGMTYPVYYSNADCKGDAYVNSCYFLQNTLFIAHTGNVMQPHCDSGGSVAALSYWSPERGCAAITTTPKMLYPITSTGMAARDYHFAELRTDLR